MCSLAPGPVCPECEADFFPAALPRCRVCAIPMHESDSICGRCLSSPPHFVGATALADYAPPVAASLKKNGMSNVRAEVHQGKNSLDYGQFAVALKWFAGQG